MQLTSWFPRFLSLILILLIGLFTGFATPAIAQTSIPAPIQPEQLAFNGPIVIENAQDAVKKFKQNQHIYMRGTPLPTDEVDRLQTILEALAA